MSNYILTFVICIILYKIIEINSNIKNGLGFVNGKLDENENFNIDLSYNGNEKKIKLEFDEKNEKLDSPLIILLPTDKTSPGVLYEKYLKETDNHENISIQNILNNIVNKFEPIEQEKFLNELSDEINTHINFYKSFSI